MINLSSNWKNYLFEFLSIFIGVTVAFALNKWNEDRKLYHAENKILVEIKNGLELDLLDLSDNIKGHKIGIKACTYFRDLINNEQVPTDSIEHYFHFLLRDYVSVQNKSGYESLKSKGLDLVSNDSLRLEIIALHDFHFEIIEKLEENYAAMQFFESYFHPINDLLADYLVFNESGQLIDIRRPIRLTKKEKNTLLHYFSRIEKNRSKYMLRYYITIEKKVKNLIQLIESEI